MSVVPPLEIVHHAPDPIRPTDHKRPDRWSPLEVITDVEVASLSPGRSLRHASIDGGHLARLVATGGHWPPLLVNKPDLTVIDGRHRLMAAQELNLRNIQVEFFSGTETEAFVQALTRNASHGLPLTLPERKDAAATLLTLRPEWSDRMVGFLCGISAPTVRDIRHHRASRPDDRASAQIVEFERRLGRDGRKRPAKPAEQRQRIAEALSENPGASLRSVASKTGASPATVRAVRQMVRNQREGPPPGPVYPPSHADQGPPGKISDETGLIQSIGAELRPASTVWAADTACSSAEGPKNFAAWFDQTRVDLPACMGHLAHVPLSRVYEVADESSRRAQAWAEFAAALQRRPAQLR